MEVYFNMFSRKNLRQIMDWSAALWAGLISGVVFFLLNMPLTQIAVGSPWVYVRLIASTVMGESVLPPPATFEIGVFLTGLAIHMVISVLLAFLIDFAIYRWGLIVGFIGGGLLGLAIYVITFYAISYFFPWFYPLRSWIMVVSHVVFGALAGGIYELIEIEEFVEVENEEGS